jgi:hypothetical protein
VHVCRVPAQVMKLHLKQHFPAPEPVSTKLFYQIEHDSHNMTHMLIFKAAVMTGAIRDSHCEQDQASEANMPLQICRALWQRRFLNTTDGVHAAFPSWSSCIYHGHAGECPMHTFQLAAPWFCRASCVSALSGARPSLFESILHLISTHR